jgi:hypothetical protein
MKETHKRELTVSSCHDLVSAANVISLRRGANGQCFYAMNSWEANRNCQEVAVVAHQGSVHWRPCLHSGRVGDEPS